MFALTNTPEFASFDFEMKDFPFYIAALGASAGGIRPLVEFFADIREADNISYVVILHSSRQDKSQLDQILARTSSLQVIKITDGLEIKANKIYIAPPSMNVSLDQKTFRLELRDPADMVNRTIDHFFTSLSEQVGAKAIGIVMSGTGRDGTNGFRAIENKKGITVTQTPETAQFDGMPVSTMMWDQPKFVSTPKEMGLLIHNIISQQH